MHSILLYTNKIYRNTPLHKFALCICTQDSELGYNIIRNRKMSGDIGDDKKGCKRKRKVANKKWLPGDEAAIISYIKQNPDFEKPSSRIYYDKFLFESGMDSDWNRLRAKVRNMRKLYCKAKEYEISKGSSMELFQDNDETLRSEMLKICWYLDDFDIIFPNDMETHNNDIYTNTLWTSSDDESSNQDPYSNINNSTTNCNPKYLPKEPVISLSSNSIKKDILAVQTGMFNFKRQKYDETATIKQQELELLREKFNFDKEKFHFDKEKFDFEKEKFRQEIKIKEKEIESQEKLKIMELQMKEKLATKELELKERIAFKPVGTHENDHNLYNHIT